MLERPEKARHGAFDFEFVEGESVRNIAKYYNATYATEGTESTERAPARRPSVLCPAFAAEAAASAE